MTRFSKYEGLGNDFLIVDGGSKVDKQKAIALCDRNFGVGADGVIETGLEQGRPFMRVTNADGSVPEMCGNGLRCVAWHLLRTSQVDQARFEVDTDAGPHFCEVDRQDDLTSLVLVEMNAPDFSPNAIGLKSESEWVGKSYMIREKELLLTAVSMGNPHLVVFDEDVDIKDLGPLLQDMDALEHGANIGFCKTLQDGSYKLDVLERGAGWTLACGTGACAAVAAAVATGRVESGRPTIVHLPGGPLTITERGAKQAMHMRGPARHVFSGSLP